MALETSPKYRILPLLLVAPPPELDSKTLLLKALHKLVTEHGTIKLVQIRKLPSQWLAFIVLEGAIQLLVGNFNNLTEL